MASNAGQLKGRQLTNETLFPEKKAKATYPMIGHLGLGKQ